MKKSILFLSVFGLAVLAASVFPLFGNSAPQTPADGDVLEALSPVTDRPAATASRGGCGGSCCSSAPGTTAENGRPTEAIRSYLTDFYKKSLGGTVEVVVKDLGCHHEADIIQNGVVVARLSINGGVITRIG
jgi:hypothetical protein